MKHLLTLESINKFLSHQTIGWDEDRMKITFVFGCDTSIVFEIEVEGNRELSFPGDRDCEAEYNYSFEIKVLAVYISNWDDSERCNLEFGDDIKRISFSQETMDSIEEDYFSCREMDDQFIEN